LVKEFTELQGIVGGLYVRAQGISGREKDPEFVDRVANVIYDQYKPHSIEDSVPRSIEGAIFSIADKADSIAGMFALGLIPSGSKDPFALRRQANGIVKIIAEHRLPIGIGYLITESLEGYSDSAVVSKFKKRSSEISIDLLQFFRDRLQFFLRDALHFRFDVVNAVLGGAFDRGDDEVSDLVERASAVDQISTSPEFEPLFIAFKRMKNIVRQAREKSLAIGVFNAMFSSEVEARLWKQINDLAENYLPFRKRREYLAAFRELVKLRDPVDSYFESVMVMVEDEEIRAMRLGVLSYLLETFNTIADLSDLGRDQSPGSE
jgi:glycyl-tRNA synthetase beta chain